MIVPLNLVMTYPVRWGRYEILRDFVQNFYDSVGFRRWHDAFEYSYDKESHTLRMWVNDVTFSYEWLMHIGASTKTAVTGSNAGYFGEGFKIASLCAIRDLSWNVHMFSDDWALDVIKMQHQIDGRSVGMLAYNIERTDHRSSSMLELSPLTECDFDLFKTVLLSFYCPENPLLGELIWEGSAGAVYTRSDYDYPDQLPCTHDFGRKGVVFCAYQVLGSNPFDLVVCYHKYQNKDRERKSLYSFDVVDVFEDVSRYIDADGAMRMLEKMRRNWNSVPTKRIDIHSWKPTVSNLIYRVAGDVSVRQAFREKYPNLLYLPPMYSVRDNNRRAQARTWLRMQKDSYLLVQRDFKELGYESLEQKCEKAGGFTRDDQPTEQEKQCFAVLDSLRTTLFEEFFCFDSCPGTLVIRNESAVYMGKVSLTRFKGVRKNSAGIRVRYNVHDIYLKERCFRRDGFYSAFATYMHECCHTFGGDQSEAFSFALTEVMERMMCFMPVINQYKVEWESLFDADS